MVAQHYRWDFIGLSTDEKPTPETSERVVDGSTFYCSDNSKLYVYCKDNWYERKSLGGGGGGTSYTAGTGIDITEDTISVDTDTIQEKLTAGTNISISDENVISATDTTYSNFTGTDGQTAGTAGLVPAPATTDVDKFLKSDGTWATSGGGGDTVYSTVTTSNSTVGGAVYIGNLNSNQEEQPDPTATDNNYKYFWALPYGSNTATPSGSSINIMGGASKSSSVVIGSEADNSIGTGAVAIGEGAIVKSNRGVSVGQSAFISNNVTDAVALGSRSNPTRNGEVNVGNTIGNGFNSTNYRVIGGVHDGQLANDAVTVGQVNGLIDAINTALSTNIPHIGASS